MSAFCIAEPAEIGGFGIIVLSQIAVFDKAPQIYLFEVDAKTKYPADAFKVIDYLTSKEVEMIASKGGWVSSLTDAEVNKNYDEGITHLGRKHLEAIFKSKPAKRLYPSDYNDVVYGSRYNQVTVDILSFFIHEH